MSEGTKFNSWLGKLVILTEGIHYSQSWDNALTQDMTASFHILHNLSLKTSYHISFYTI